MSETEKEKQFHFLPKGLATFMAVAVAIVAALILLSGPKASFGLDTLWEYPAISLAILIAGVVCGGIAYIIWLILCRLVYVAYAVIMPVDHIAENIRQRKQLHGELKQDFVTTLVTINFKYIDAYYLQTKVQADKSFLMTAIVALFSFLLISIGIGFTFFGKVEAATISVASGVLGQFISAVFFYLYNQTILKMSEYHRKLVFTQNISLALKISESLGDGEKNKAQLSLIESLSKDINTHLAT